MSPSDGVVSIQRLTSGAATTSNTLSGYSPPYWLKLEKDGSIVSTYSSPDGTTWKYVAVTHLVFSGPVDIGFYVTSHNLNSLSTATFNHVISTSAPAFSPPAPWLDQDIGTIATGQTGAVHYENALWTIFASGTDIYNNADAFHFCYEPLTGDGQIIAEVTAQSTVNAWAKSGVLIRQDLTPGSVDIGLYVTPSNGTVVEQRTAENGSTGNAAVANSSADVPMWLKITRTGNTFNEASDLVGSHSRLNPATSSSNAGGESAEVSPQVDGGIHPDTGGSNIFTIDTGDLNNGGNEQTVAAGAIASNPLDVLLTNSSGGAISGASIKFSIASGSDGELATSKTGSFATSQTVTTNSSGVATIYYEAGSDIIVNNSITATDTADSLSVTFTEHCGTQ